MNLKVLISTCFLALLFALPVHSATPRIDNYANFQTGADKTQWSISTKNGNTPNLRFYTYQGTSVWDSTGWTAKFKYGKNSSTTIMYEIVGTSYTNYIDFQATTNSFPKPFDKWYSVIELSNGTNYNSQPTGLISVERGAEATAGRMEYSWPTINWLNYLYSNTTNGPYLPGSNTSFRAAGTNGQVYIDIPSAGLGDMIGANNLSEITSPSTARTNLELGSASTNSNSDFATADQGIDATNALAQLAIETNRAIQAEALLLPTSTYTNWLGTNTYLKSFGVSTGLVDIGTANNPIPALSGATVASLALADSAVQAEVDTLQSVANRGSTVTNIVVFSNGISAGPLGRSYFTDGTSFVFLADYAATMSAVYFANGTSYGYLANGVWPVYIPQGGGLINSSDGYLMNGTNLNLIYLGINANAQSATYATLAGTAVTSTGLVGFVTSTILTNNQTGVTLGGTFTGTISKQASATNADLATTAVTASNLVVSGNLNMGGYSVTNFLTAYTPAPLSGVSNTITLGGNVNYYSWILTNTSTLYLTPCASNVGASARVDIQKNGQTFTINSGNCITSGLGNVSLLTNVGNMVQSYLFDQAIMDTNVLKVGGYQLR